MNYPVWPIPWLGNGPLLTLMYFGFAVASHFAAGGSLIMVLLEHKAQREGNQPLLWFLQNWSRFFLLMTMIVCVVLAVGCLQVTAVTQPAVFSALVRILFWVWGMIWVLVLVMVAAALLYYSGWGVVAPGHHLALGWIFVGCAWAALFITNGVLSFMQTPGEWLKTGKLVNGFFNESFNPGLLVHGGTALGVAGLFSLVAGVAADLPRLRTALVRMSSGFVAGGFFLLPLGEAWGVAVLPPEVRAFLSGPVGALNLCFYGSILISVVVFLFVVTGPLNRPESCTRALALLLLILGLVVAFASGWARQSFRAPYAISGYLYVNGIGQAEAAAMNRDGFLKSARYAGARLPAAKPQAAGRELFRMQCMTCHTVSGFNPIRRAVKGWDLTTIERQLKRLEELAGHMVPFVGTAEERGALAEWLAEEGAR